MITKIVVVALAVSGSDSSDAVRMLRDRLPDNREGNSACEGWNVSFTILFTQRRCRG